MKNLALTTTLICSAIQFGMADANAGACYELSVYMSIINTTSSTDLKITEGYWETREHIIKPHQSKLMTRCDDWYDVQLYTKDTADQTATWSLADVCGIEYIDKEDKTLPNSFLQITLGEYVDSDTGENKLSCEIKT